MGGKDNVMGGRVEKGEGGQHIEREREREGRRTQCGQQRCGGVYSELEHAVAQ